MIDADIAGIIKQMERRIEILEQEKKITTLAIYPVGATYIGTINTNPSAFLGGTWQLTGSGSLLGSTCYLWKRTV